MACALTVSAFGTPSFGTASAAELTADQITEEMKIGWNIGNSLDSIPSTSDISKHETAWGNPVVTQELINAVKAKGFNTIRIPTTWYPHITNDNGTYTIDTAWLARVKEVVDYAYNQGMYVILNVHHEEWVNRSDFGTAYNEISPELTQVWKQIAAYFKDYDQHLIFEGMNEPRAVGTDYEWGWGVPQECYDTVNKLNADFIEAVRSVDSPYQNTRLLMIPSYVASHELANITQLVIPEDDKYIAASIHAYSPYDFTMDTTGTHDTFTAAHEAYLDTAFQNIQATFTDKDIPVVIGEFGSSDYENTAAREEWATYYLTWTKKLGIPCVLWDNDAVGNSDKSEIHAYIDRDTYEWYANGGAVVDAMMSVMNDSSVVWDSEEHKPTYAHADLSTGDVIWEGDKTITASSSGVPITQAQVTAGEIAVKYTGTTPVLAFMDSSWGNWTEISPYDVDETNGIAYYKSDDIAKAWGDVSTIASVALKITSGECSYTKIVALGEAGISTDTTTQPTGTTTTTKTTTTTTDTTTAPTGTTTTSTSTTNGGESGEGKSYTLNDGTVYKYEEMDADNRMIGWAYEDFGIGANEKVTRVDVTISSIASEIGTWQGAFGSSTIEEPDYWTMTDQMEETFDGKTGTISWIVDAKTSEIIQTQYGGQVKFGIWWIDCNAFKVDSVTIYTDGAGESTSTTTTNSTNTTTTTTTTTTSVSSGSTTTTITTNGGSSEDGVYKLDDGTVYKYEEMDSDNRMIGWAYEDFGIGADEKVTRVDVTISAIASKIGTWQGAFGSSTIVEPDYWTMTDQMEETFDGKTGTISWIVDSATSEIIQTQYGGQVKFGIWWIDCNAFKVDSVTIYTDKASTSTTQSSDTTTTTSSTTKTTASTTTTTTTKESDTTTSKTTTTTSTSKTTATTTSTSKTTATTTTTTGTPAQVTVGDVNMDGKISLKDIILLNKYVAKMVTLNDSQLKAAECTSDGNVNADDVIALMKYIVNLVDALPTSAN
ncbi:MAG: cellulase family glycosylhydrolase [Ruminococcus sp.]